MAVPLVALKSLRYAGEAYAAGDRFDARDPSDALVLKLTKLADDYTPPAQDDPPEPEIVSVIEPEAQPAVESYPVESAADYPSPSRRRQRRTVTTEE